MVVATQSTLRAGTVQAEIPSGPASDRLRRHAARVSDSFAATSRPMWRFSPTFDPATAGRFEPGRSSDPLRRISGPRSRTLSRWQADPGSPDGGSDEAVSEAPVEALDHA